MNERIKELAERAGFDAASMVAFDIKEDLAKFAELIVRECANAIDNADNEVRVCTAMAYLCDYFGMEEQ